MNFVYLIYNGNGHAKIGHTNDLERRLRELQTGSPHKLEVLLTIESNVAEKIESEIHHQLSNLRVEGEWFVFGAETLRVFMSWIPNQCRHGWAEICPEEKIRASDLIVDDGGGSEASVFEYGGQSIVGLTVSEFHRLREQHGDYRSREVIG